MMTPADAEQVIRDSLPGFSFEQVAAASHGWSFWTFVVDGEWVFRFPRTDDDAHLLEREFALLPTLAARLPLAIPKYEHKGAWDGRTFGGYRRILGEPIPAAAVRSGSPLAQDIGEFLTALHSFPTEMAANRWQETNPPALWLKQQRAFQAECAERVFPLLSPRDRMVASELFRRFNQELGHEGAGTVLAHCNLRLEHLLVEDGNLRGVIDWSDAAIGDPAIDFAGVRGNAPMSWLRQVIEYYDRPTGERFMDRINYYYCVTPLHDVLRGLATGDRGLVKTGARGFSSRTH